MAGVVKVNGKYHTEELVSRDLFFKNIKVAGGLSTAAEISNDEFDALMKSVHLTSTIEVIGVVVTTEDFIADNTLSTTDITLDGVNIVISGADVDDLSNDGTPGSGNVDFMSGVVIADIDGF